MEISSSFKGTGISRKNNEGLSQKEIQSNKTDNPRKQEIVFQLLDEGAMFFSPI